MEQVKKVLESLKAFWQKLSAKVKKLILIGGVGILAAAIVITVAMNVGKSGYEILFPSITSAEASEIYSRLQEESIPVQLNSKGQLLVPAEQLDTIIFKMQSEGFPKSGPTYDLFLNNISATSTDYERRKVYLFMIQDRLQTTITSVDGVRKAIVTINVPESSGLAWSSTDSESSASVMLTLDSQISDDAVLTIKKLVAANVENCKAENVVVMDTATNIELGDETGGMSYSLQQFDYERQLAKRAENAVKTLYSPSYGADGLTVAASFTIDTDKMKEESKTYMTDDNGNQIQGHYDEQYVTNGNIPAQGIAGEENNTDVPDYVADGNEATDGLKSYARNIDYENSYVLRQIERGTAPIKAASITLLLNEENLTAARQDEIASQVSRATGIAVENVVIGTMTPAEAPVLNPGGGETQFYENPIFLMGIAGVLLIIIMAAVVVPIMLSRKRKRKEAAKMKEVEEEQAAAADAAARAQAEIDLHKNKLKYEAEAQLIQDGSMTEEIRSFAKENPEMTAMLIRSLLKEEGE